MQGVGCRVQGVDPGFSEMGVTFIDNATSKVVKASDFGARLWGYGILSMMIRELCHKLVRA